MAPECKWDRKTNVKRVRARELIVISHLTHIASYYFGAPTEILGTFSVSI